MNKNEFKNSIKDLSYNELIDLQTKLKSQLCLYNTQRGIEETKGKGSNPKDKKVNSKVLQLSKHNDIVTGLKSMDMVKYGLAVVSNLVNLKGVKK